MGIYVNNKLPGYEGPEEEPAPYPDPVPEPNPPPPPPKEELTR